MNEPSGANRRLGARLAIALFTLVAIAHLLRLVFTLDITVEEWTVPQWISVIGCVVPALVAWLIWRESR